MANRSIEKICSIEHCEKVVHARTWCQGHYKRWTKYGDPLLYKLMRGDDEARFWAFVDKEAAAGPNGKCWGWKGCLSRGYGQIWIAGKMVLAHRYVFFLTHGYWPKPVGRHSCDVPTCCNPDHIVEGTQLDNIRDKMKRGRHRNQYGPC